MPVWLIGPRAPSLTFYSGRPVVRLSDADADRQLGSEMDGWIVARTTVVRRVTAPACRMRGRISVVDQVGTMTLAYVRRGTSNCRLP
jgi:hypothetical protein